MERVVGIKPSYQTLCTDENLECATCGMRDDQMFLYLIIGTSSTYHICTPPHERSDDAEISKNDFATSLFRCEILVFDINFEGGTLIITSHFFFKT